jgi:hypothetical protein
MGASLVDLQTMLRLRKAGFLPPTFSIAEIGAQQLSNDILRDPDILPACAEAFGVPLRNFGTAPPTYDGTGVEHLPADAPFAKDFWEWLGCSYMATDLDTSPHIIPLDLNFDEVPTAHRGKYDLVTNFGTTEHVVNQMQAMKIIHDLTAAGGLIMHTVPVQGYVDHGLFNYNPRFFELLALSCRYRICALHGGCQGKAGPPAERVVKVLTQFEPGSALAAHHVTDAYLQVVFLKVEDIAFVPPIEIHAGGVIDDDRIRSRYWTIFGGEKS